MSRSIWGVVAATVALLGLGQSQADASSVPPTPGIGPALCDGLTGTCTNPIFVRPVVIFADRFTPTPGGPPHPQVWSLGQPRIAEGQDADLSGAEQKQAFAVGEIRVRPYSTGFVSFATFGFGRFVASNNPLHPYRFEGVEFSHDPDLLRRQDFEFVGEQTGPVPPPPKQ